MTNPHFPFNDFALGMCAGGALVIVISSAAVALIVMVARGKI